MIRPQALQMARNAYQKYKTRDPLQIICDRNILLKEFDEPESLLGFYTVMNRRQVIGINRAADAVQRKTGLIHELGHSLNDYKAAASGNHFSDSFEDCRLFSFSNAPKEFNANLTGADLCIDDAFILDQIHFLQYQEAVTYISEHIDRYKTPMAKMRFEEERMLDFFYENPDIPSFEMLAGELGVDVQLVKFKFRALNYRGYELPNIPETRSDFLKNWQR